MQNWTWSIIIGVARWIVGVLELWAAAKMLVLAWILYASLIGLVSAEEWAAFRADPGAALLELQPFIVAIIALRFALLMPPRMPSLESLCWIFMFGALLMTHEPAYALGVFAAGGMLRLVPEVVWRWRFYRTHGFLPF